MSNYVTQSAAFGDHFVVSQKLGANDWRELGKCVVVLYNSLMDECARCEFQHDVISIYMDEYRICIGLDYVHQFVLLNPLNLQIVQVFGQTFAVNEPFYIYESDFTNFINVMVFYCITKIFTFNINFIIDF